ncbi:hypothetical protein CF326_g707 [Tilletia indica]|nr:hypothetical protein CF326_g707 [Tilletia indica]
MRSIISTTALLVSVLASTSLALPQPQRPNKFEDGSIDRRSDFIVTGNTGTIYGNGNDAPLTTAKSTTKYVNGGLTTVIGPGFTAISGNGGSGPLVPLILTTRVTSGVATVFGPGVFTVLPTATAAAQDPTETDTADDTDYADTDADADTADDADDADTDADTDGDVAPQTTPAPTSRPSTGAAAPGVYGASGIALVAGAVALGAALVAM